MWDQTFAKEVVGVVADWKTKEILNNVKMVTLCELASYPSKKNTEENLHESSVENPNLDRVSLTENYVHLGSFSSFGAKRNASRCLDARIPENFTRDFSNIRGLRRIAVGSPSEHWHSLQLLTQNILNVPQINDADDGLRSMCATPNASAGHASLSVSKTQF